MTNRLLAVFLLAAQVISACASGQAAPGTAPNEALTSAETQALAQPTPQLAPVETAAVAVKGEFEATDPTTVSLALGKPQFVEFFAFW